MGVHHLHLWSLASDVPALSAHVVLAGDPTVAGAQRCAAALRAALAERFGIVNVTLELECEARDQAQPAGPPDTGGDQVRTASGRPAIPAPGAGPP